MNEHRIGPLQATRVGFAQAVASWPSILLSSALGLFQAVLGLLGLWMCLAMLGVSVPATTGSLVMVVWLSLMLALFRAWVGTAFMIQAKARIEGGEVSSLANAIGQALMPGMQYFVLSVLLEWLWTGWKWLSMASVFVAYTSSLSTGLLGEWTSLSVALWLTVVGPLSFLLSVWTRLGWVRAVLGNQSVPVGFFEAASVLVQRPWPYIGTAVIFGVLTLVSESTLTAMVSVFQLRDGSFSSVITWNLVQQLVAGSLTAWMAGYIGLAHLASNLVLETNREGKFDGGQRTPEVTLAQIVVEDTPPAPENGENVGG